MVTVKFKPKPTAMAAFRTLIDENAHHASANRGASLALRHARIHGRTIASCFGKSMIAARPSHLQPPHFAAFDKTSADWS
jgi:quinol monooxygenase YgiN